MADNRPGPVPETVNINLNVTLNIPMLGEALGILNAIQQQGVKIMATLQQILDDVTAETTSLDSISTLISGLQQQLADALSGTTLPPAVQSKVDAIFTGAEANKAKIAAALASNVPPTPAP